MNGKEGGYRDWPEVLQNLKKAIPNLLIVQLGLKDDMTINEVDIDLRGKTSIHQMASIIKNANLHLGIDSFPVHICSMYSSPLVALYGCSLAKSTGPWYKDTTKAKFILLQSERNSGCKNRPCYKNKCKHNPTDGAAPINEIDPLEIFKSCVKLLLN